MKYIEVLLSILYIFSFLSILTFFNASNEEKIKIQTIYALKALDYSNELRNLVFNNDTKTIEKRLKEFLPINYEYKVCINCFLILDNKEIYSVSYFISTNFTNIGFYQVNVYIIKKP
jgi:hypothetical protein